MNKAKNESKRSREKRQKKFDLYEIPEFGKKFRGYDPEEVDHYLNALVDAYTKMYEECEGFKKTADEFGALKEKLAYIRIKEELAVPPEQETADISEDTQPTEAMKYDVEKLFALLDQILAER